MILGLKPYPKVKDSGIPWLGNVPIGWPVLPLKRIGAFQSGAGFPISAQGHSSGDVLFAKVSDMNIPGNERHIHVSKNAVSREVARRLGARIFGRNAIIFPKVGGALLTNKRRVLTTDTCIDNNLMACVVTGADSLFVYRMLSWLDLALLAKPGPVPAISEGEVREIRIALPSVQEQTAIARYLDHMDRRILKCIRAKEKLIALLDEYKQALIHQAVTGRIDVRTGKPYPTYKPSGIEWLGKVPAHWQVVRNGQLFVQRHEVGFSELPILEVSLVSGVRVRDFENSNRKQIMADRNMYKRAIRGDIAYNMMRMWQGAVGVAPVDGLVSPAYVVAKPRAGTESRYFDHLYHTSTYMIEVDKYSRGIVKDRNRLYWEDFKRMPTPCPPPDEQVQIADAIDREARFTSIGVQNARRQISLANEYRTRLIADVVTGKLDVREAAAELPDMSATSCGDGIDTMQAGSNSQERKLGFTEEANA